MGGEKATEDLPQAVARPHSPSALVAFTACVHRTELERAAAAGLVRKPHYPNAALDALVERGHAHEKAHLDDLRAQGLDTVEIPEVDFRDAQAVNEAVRLTAEAMTSGRSVIYQATFLQTERGVSWRARADFLRRIETPSGLGAWSYEPWDTKLAREAKASALLQLCVYAELIAHIQGTMPEQVHLILGGPGRPSDSYRLKSIAPYYRQVRKDFIARLGTGQPSPTFPVTDPYPEPVEHCEVCDWSSICEKRWHDDDHVSLVAGITRNQRKALRARGVTTLTDLSRQSLPFAPPLERARPASIARIREQARVQREGREQDKPVSELILRDPITLVCLPSPRKDPGVVQDGHRGAPQETLHPDRRSPATPAPWPWRTTAFEKPSLGPDRVQDNRASRSRSPNCATGHGSLLNPSINGHAQYR